MLEKNQIHSHYAEKYNSMKGMKITQSIKTVFNFEKTRDEKGMKERTEMQLKEKGKERKGVKRMKRDWQKWDSELMPLNSFFFFLSSSLYFLSFLLTLNAIVDY